jgi:archaemetzincin
MSKIVVINLIFVSLSALGQPTSRTNEECLLFLKKLDVSMATPQPGEWLYQHKEDGQSFEKYIQSKPVKATSQRNKIYLQPIGKFTVAQRRVIQFTADYLRLFFDRQVEVLPAIGAWMVAQSQRRYPNTDSEQLLTTPILNYLEKNIPNDGIVIMAMTAKDLYPSSDYNFVFGIARTQKRVGVSSLFRYANETMDVTNYQKCLERLIKTSSHEITHMLSVQHCIAAVCLMNGSNSLSESDNRPNRLCSTCLPKLQWNLQFDIYPRLERIAAYFKKHQLEMDLKFAQADMNAIAK